MSKENQKSIRQKRQQRRRRVRAKVRGTKQCPRLAPRRSLRAFYAQLIDDASGHTLAAATDQILEKDKKTYQRLSKLVPGTIKKHSSGLQRAYLLGLLMAEKAAAIKIKRVVFDRGHYQYQGRIRALADGARAGGLKF